MFVGAYVGIIVLVTRAKPLGDLPYHWATFVAGKYMLLGLMVALITRNAIGTLIGLCCVLEAVALFRRERYGAVLHLVANFLIAFAALVIGIVSLMNHKSEDAAVMLLAGALYAIPVGLNFVYFARRWKYLSRPVAAWRRSPPCGTVCRSKPEVEANPNDFAAPEPPVRPTRFPIAT